MIRRPRKRPEAPSRGPPWHACEIGPKGSPDRRAWSSGRGGWELRFQTPLPKDPLLNGLTLYAQAIFVDPPSNALGLVFSQGLSMTMAGSGPPLQLVGHYDTTSATGFSTAGNGIVIEFDGVFN